MIRSMTAFSRASADLGPYFSVWELRTVNHRYLEILPKLPEGYRDLEPEIRERVRSRLERGKLDVSLRLTEAEGEGGLLELDHRLAGSLVELSKEAVRELGTAGGLTTGELLQWPGVVRPRSLEMEEARRRLLEALETGLDDLVTAREREGGALADLLRERLEGVAAGTARIRGRLPEVRAAFRERLHDRLSELLERVDADRLEQEVAYLAQRSDVAEELDRLETHLAEARRILEEGGAVGRRLDFLLQEMHREVNTIGAKSPDAEVSQVVVDLKVLVEQMREQAQNLE